MNAKEFRIEQSKIKEKLNVLNVAQGNLKDELIHEIKSIVTRSKHLLTDLEVISCSSHYSYCINHLVRSGEDILVDGTLSIYDLTFNSCAKILERLEELQEEDVAFKFYAEGMSDEEIEQAYWERDLDQLDG